MFNKIIMVGNLTRDLELRYAPSGTAIGSTGLASNRKFKSANGEQKEEVCFVDVTFFGRTAEIANQYLRKGSKVLVEGRLKLDSWTDQNGGKRSKHSITVESMQMLDSRGENSGGGYGQPDNNSYNNPPQQNSAPSQMQQQNNYGGSQNQSQGSSIPEIDINDDEIPF
ncbi:MAG: single-stranded DNA-binding protein [Epsilonproteobacteria bacterium]|nr:single-stranded DNA-binding protein [Campylobacterota bacterium]